MPKKQITSRHIVTVTYDEGTKDVGEQIAQRIYTYQGVNSVEVVLDQGFGQSYNGKTVGPGDITILAKKPTLIERINQMLVK